MTCTRVTFATLPLRKRAESMLSDAMGFLLHRIVRRIARAIEIRNARRMLGALPDSTLKDIGISRSDIDAVSADLLDRKSARQSRGWAARTR